MTESKDAAESKNAVITSATITSDDHGMLSAWLHLDYGGSGQGFGGYCLYLPKNFKHYKVSGPNYAGTLFGECWRLQE